MKPLRSLLCFAALSTIALATIAALVPAHAQTVVDSAAVSELPAADTAASVATSVVNVLSAVLPVKFASLLVALASVCGTIGFFTKPLMTAIESLVRSSPSTGDDALLDKVEHSRAFKIFAWLLDFFVRVKIGPQFTAKPEAPPTS